MNQFFFNSKIGETIYKKVIQRNYKQQVECSLENDAKDNSALALYIMVDQSKYFNNGKPYVHAHIHKVVKELPYEGIFAPCIYQHDKSSYYIGALDCVTITDKKAYQTLYQVGKYESEMCNCINSVENEVLFSCMLDTTGIVAIDDVCKKFNIRYVFIRTDSVTDKVKFNGNIFYTKLGYFTTLMNCASRNKEYISNTEYKALNG